MRRYLFVVTASLAAVVLVGSQALAAKAPTVPAASSAFGMSRSAWTQVWGNYVLGDPSDPMLTGLCGKVIGKAFLMVAPVALDEEVDCDVPAGMPIVFAHAGFFAWIPVDGSNDAEIEAASVAGFAPDSSSVTVDGAAVVLSTTSSGAFDVHSEPGSLYDTIGVGTGTVRTAITGQLTILHPLTPGDHEVEAAVDFTTIAGVEYSITYHVHVG
jgi:hypothetical protein